MISEGGGCGQQIVGFDDVDTRFDDVDANPKKYNSQSKTHGFEGTLEIPKKINFASRPGPAGPVHRPADRQARPAGRPAGWPAGPVGRSAGPTGPTGRPGRWR